MHSVKPNRAILRQHIYQSFFSQMQKIIFTRFTRIIATVALLSAATFSSFASANDEAGKLLFLKGASPACAICHTLEAAGAAGAVGPSMNELQPDAARVVNALKNGIGQMPAYTSLTPEQVKILSEYVAKASRQ